MEKFVDLTLGKIAFDLGEIYDTAGDTHITTYLRRYFNEGKTSFSVFVDLEKTFEGVDWNTLFFKF